MYYRHNIHLMIRLPYILIFVFLVLIGCRGTGDYGRKLAEVETLIADSPDSAMAIIAQVDTVMLPERQKDRLTLLSAYTCIVHNEPVDMPELMSRRAMSAFDGSFTADEVKALIIKSVNAKSENNSVGRIEYLKDAEFIALQLDSKFDLGIIYRNLANVYEQGFNGTVSKYYADKAVAMFRELDCKKQLMEARMAVAGAFCAKRDYKGALDSLLAMKDEVMANASHSYKIFYLDFLARAYDENGRSAEAVDIWHSIAGKQEMTSNTLAHWARAYWHMNEPDSAYRLIQEAIKLPHNATDEYLCRNVEYSILEKMGRHRELAAVDSLRSRAANRVFDERKLEESSLALNQKYDSATRQAWLDASIARYRTRMAVLAVIITIVVAASLLLYFWKRNQLLKVRHENDVLRMRALSDNLFESDSRHKATSSKISELFQSRFHLIDELAVSWFECKETVSEQKRIYNKVKESINSFSSAEATQEIEDVVNSCNDNLMTRFREDFPKLSNVQYRLALYLFCGLSLQSISVFTGTELRNIYVYKSRLKGVITKSDCVRKEEYLSYFG